MAKGTVYLIIANLVFTLVSYVIAFWLGRYLGPVDYGTFGVVISIMSTVNLLMTSGIPQSASKYIAEDNTQTEGIIKAANKLQLVFCALIFILYLGLSGVIANLLNDDSLTPYIRISALAVPAYALYAIYVNGYFNGLRRFGRQSISGIVASIGKLAATVVLVLAGFGVTGALAGYIAGAVIGSLLAWRLLGKIERNKTPFDWKKLAGFSIPAIAFAVAFFLLMSIDLLAVKAMAAGDAEAGYYTAVTTISRAPYFLFAGLAMSLLPSISKSTATNNTELTRSYIRQSVRYMLMLLVPVVVLISATSSGLLTLAYSTAYISAAGPLSILVFGLGAFTVFLVLANIVMGSGKPASVMVMALLLVAIDIVLNIWLIPRYGLNGAAWATTISGLLGMLAVSVYVIRQFRTLINIGSLGKIGLASIVIYVIALITPCPPGWLPLIYIGLLMLYAGLLWLMKEIKQEDIAVFKRILPVGKLT